MLKRFLLPLTTLLFLLPFAANASLADDLSGRIILQVEKNGEAWYINPESNEIHFLGRPLDAFNLMRDLGLGISNENLLKLQGEGNEEGNHDLALSRQLAGKILLQVEDAGQAWYINPTDLRRYYLGTPDDAFRVLREQGLGIAEVHFDDLPKSPEYVSSNDVLMERWSDIMNKSIAIGKSYNYDLQSLKEKGEISEQEFNQYMSEFEFRWSNKFYLESPLSTEDFGYLGSGWYVFDRNLELISYDVFFYSEDYSYRPEFFMADDYSLRMDHKDSSDMLTEVRKIQTSLELYFADFGWYPTTAAEGVIIPMKSGISAENGLFAKEGDRLYGEYSLPYYPGGDVRYTSLDDGLDYSIEFTLPAAINGFEAGKQTVGPAGSE